MNAVGLRAHGHAADLGTLERMVQDASLGDENAPPVIDIPFQPELLSLVVRGEDQVGTWELYDGPHPSAYSDDAVGSYFVTERREGGGSTSGSIGPRLQPDQLCSVGSSASSGRKASSRVGYLQVQCSAAVAMARVYYDDGSEDEIATVRSPATGARWVVCPLDSPRSPLRLDLVDAAGNLLGSVEVRDPRKMISRPPPRPPRFE